MKSKNRNVKCPATLRTGTTAWPLRTGLAVGVSTMMLLPQAALAQDKATATKLGTVKVQDSAIDPNPNAEQGVPYKARTSGDERHTRPLAETPQNITVITKSAIDESGATDLKQILDGQPGITLGTGENGNAFGDRYIIRGQEARSDVFVDGLRDPGMTIRESFAIEQLEISKGPNSSFAGRGTSGGAVNAVTKQATRDYNFTKLSTGFGTDHHTRLTMDANEVLGDHFALRGNALYSYEEVPDRAPADRDRKGVALSGLYTPTEKLDITLDYYHLRAEDTPDLGGFLDGDYPNRRPARHVPVYAQQQDFLESDVDVVTARVKYKFNDNVRLTNLSRRGSADNGYVATGARASTTDATDSNGAYDTISLSTHQGWQEVDYLANQMNLFVNQTLAGMKHEFIFGWEYTDHDVRNGIYNVTNAGENCVLPGRARPNQPTPPPSAGWCAIGAGGNPVNGLNTVMNRQISKGTWDTDWSVNTHSLSVMDTVDLSDDWTVFAGLRYDHYDFDLGTQSTATPPTAEPAHYGYSDKLWNGHLGVTYDITSQGMVYLTYSTAADINGGESDVGTSSGYGGVVISDGDVAGADPEKSETFELGTKWNVMDDALLLTAAVFQITKSDVMEGVDYSSVGTFNTGKNRVRGVELGLVGDITDRLMGQVGVTVMDAEVLKSAARDNQGNELDNEGRTLSNFADKSASAQLRYEFTEQFALGGGMRYEDKRYAGQPDTAAANADGHYSQPIPSYAVYDMFATYRVNKNLDMRLNVNNVTDKDYYLAGYRSGSFLYMGDARSYRLTLNYEFN